MLDVMARRTRPTRAVALPAVLAIASCGGAGSQSAARPLAAPEAAPLPTGTSPVSSLRSAAPGKRLETAPEMRDALEPRELRSFASEEAACAVMGRREAGVAGACAPFRTQRTCRLVRDSRGSAALLELGIVETVPTEHCANHPGAPRADVKSVIVAPVTSSKGLRVGVESLVRASSVSTMRGQHDGVVSLEATASLGEHQDAEQVLVFKVLNDDCVLVFMVCGHDFGWCTVPREISSCQDDGDARKLHFARDAGGLRVTMGRSELGGRSLFYPLTRGPDVADR